MRKLVRRVGAVVLVLATLIAGEAILRNEPNYYETAAPFYIKAEPKVPVRTGTILVTLLDARGAAKLKRPDGGIIDTDGVWVIVRIRLEATTRTTNVTYLALADDRGRTYRISGRFTQKLSEYRWDLQPGIPVAGEIAFEVPRDAATILRLRVSETVTNISSDFLPLTDIRVPVTEQMVSAWLADTTPATLSDPTVVT